MAVAVLLLAVSGGDIVLSQKLDFVCRLLLLLLRIPFFKYFLRCHPPPSRVSLVLSLSLFFYFFFTLYVVWCAAL